MPELPEVEVLARSLRPLILNRVVRDVRVLRTRVIRPCSERTFARTLLHGRFSGLERRGKYLLFTLQRGKREEPITLVGHLGMTGRMYLVARQAPLPKHAAVVLDLGRERFVFEDTRYFGRMTFDCAAVGRLGPEPLGANFTADYLGRALNKSSQPIKVKLLDQSLVAGVGNIYASEALFRAGISPRLAARRLKAGQVELLWRAIRAVLAEAIQFGSTVPLNYSGDEKGDGLFYFGSAGVDGASYEERLLVYDRAGFGCSRCGSVVRRIVQAGRSTFYCPECQGSRSSQNPWLVKGSKIG